MKKFLLTALAMLSMGAYLMPRPLAAAKTLGKDDPAAARAAAALALTFGGHDKKPVDPFAQGNAKRPPGCECGENCAGGSACPGHCDRTTCVNAVAKGDGKGCTCGCVQTGKCICPNCDAGNKGDKPHCTCGCTETGQCRCPDCNHPQGKPVAGKDCGCTGPKDCSCATNSCNCASCVKALGKNPPFGGSCRPMNDYPIPYPDDPVISAADAATHPRAPYIDTDMIPGWNGSDPFLSGTSAKVTTGKKNCTCSDPAQCSCDPYTCQCPTCLKLFYWAGHDEDQLDLMNGSPRGDKQVGAYQISTGRYLPRTADGWGPRCAPPIKVPADPTALIPSRQTTTAPVYNPAPVYVPAPPPMYFRPAAPAFGGFQNFGGGCSGGS